MHNEIFFFIQSFLVIAFALAACRLGSGALTTWVAIQALIANLFVLKQIHLFGFEVTASDTFAIGSLVGLNLLQEYFGRKEAQQATMICFLMLFFYTLVSQLHLLYLPSPHDFSQSAYEILLTPALRLFLASMGTFFVVQQMDIFFFSFLKKTFPNSSLAFRMCLSLVVLQFLDTLLFSFTGLYGMVISLIDVIIVSFFIKLLAIFSFTTAIKWIKT